MAKRGWTQEEDEFLIECYKSLDWTVESIAKEIGKSKDTVSKRASFLGIKKIKFSDIPVPEGHKLCRKCRKIKPYSEFYNNRSKKNDAYDSRCKSCASESEKIRRHNRIMAQITAQIQNESNKEELERINFLEANKGKIFTCPKCKEDYTIENYSVYKKNGKITRNTWCKYCVRKKSEESELKRLRKQGHR